VAYDQVQYANAAWYSANQANASAVEAIAIADAAQVQTIADDAAQSVLQQAINDAAQMQTISIAYALDVETKALDDTKLSATTTWAANLNTPWSSYQLTLATAQDIHDNSYADAQYNHDSAIATATGH